MFPLALRRDRCQVPKKQVRLKKQESEQAFWGMCVLKMTWLLLMWTFIKRAKEKSKKCQVVLYAKTWTSTMKTPTSTMWTRTFTMWTRTFTMWTRTPDAARRSRKPAHPARWCLKWRFGMIAQPRQGCCYCSNWLIKLYFNPEWVALYL